MPHRARGSRGRLVRPARPWSSDLAPDSPRGERGDLRTAAHVVHVRGFDQGLAAIDSSRSPSPPAFSHATRTRSSRRGLLPAGNLYVNRGITGAIVARQPFGGFRLSGMGSQAGGPDYLRQFTRPRVITENTMRHGLEDRPRLNQDERTGRSMPARPPRVPRTSGQPPACAGRSVRSTLTVRSLPPRSRVSWR